MDAADLCVLFAQEAPDRYERAARRPLERLVTEQAALTLDEAQLAIACLRGLPLGDTGRLSERAPYARRRQPGLERTLAVSRWSAGVGGGSGARGQLRAETPANLVPKLPGGVGPAWPREFDGD